MSSTTDGPAQPEDVAKGVSGTSITGTVNVDDLLGGGVAGISIKEAHFHGVANLSGQAIAQENLSPEGQSDKRLFHVPIPTEVFTGREREFEALHEGLHPGDNSKRPVPQALHGMGGVGKSQTAARYADLHGDKYSSVFWVRGDSPERFDADLARLATDLNLPVLPQSPQDALLRAVRDWFATHENWLLVVDNAANLLKLKHLLPQHPTGRILLTTLETVPSSFADCIEILHLKEDAGALLLLRRAGILGREQQLDAADEATQAEAKAISQELGGLPLALDYAGAYIQQRKVTPATYLQYYKQRRQKLHINDPESDHPPVAITFSMALEQVELIEKFGPAAAELARMCAFLAPDTIPDTIFLKGSSVLNEPLAAFAADEIDFADVCEAACRYALMRRENNPSGLWMHRLTQEVLRESLQLPRRRDVAERVVLAINCAFPRPDCPVWAFCERLLPHALTCIPYIANFNYYMVEAARLLTRTATYLQERARYSEAEPFFQEAIAIYRQVKGAEHEWVADALNNLALLYRDMSFYDEAALLLEEALEIGRKTLGEDHTHYASLMDNLAGVYYVQKRYDEAVLLFEQASNNTRLALGTEHPQVAICYNNLANVYSALGRYADAETLLKNAMAIDHKTIGENHPEYATRLVNLAGLYIECNWLDEAERLLTQALELRERTVGSEHPHTAHCHFWLGMLRNKQGQVDSATICFRRALEIRERVLGPQHQHTMIAHAVLERVEQENLTPAPASQ